MKSAFASFVLGLLCCTAAAPLWAQSRFVCRDSAGGSYASTRPCPSGAATVSASVGPATSGTSYRYEPPTVVRPAVPGPSYQSLMSGRCQTLSDTLRNAYGRGISSEVQAGMRSEYERDCRDEEREASSRYYQQQRDASQRKREEERQTQFAMQSLREQDTRRAEQCAELRRILNAKRARPDLTEGEKKDLRRSEDAFETRCQR